MKYSSIPPGDDPMIDAYNLMVSAWHADHKPLLASEAERMAKAISRSVNDWEEIAGYLALLACRFAHFCDEAIPAGQIKPSEKMRQILEEHISQPV
jgi:hypothetical protein